MEFSGLLSFPPYAASGPPIPANPAQWREFEAIGLWTGEC